MTVHELLSRISSYELAEWMAFHILEPFGDVRDDWRMGVQASLFANVNREKGAKTFTPLDFMLDIDKEPIDPDERAKEVSRSLGATLSKMVTKKKQ